MRTRPGNRVKSVVYDGDDSETTTYIGDYYEKTLTVEYVGGQPVMTLGYKKYYYAGSIRLAMREDSDNPLYLIGDHLGSTSLVIDTNGDQVAKRSYMPFGETWGSSVADLPTTFAFTGQREAPEIGLNYYIARWYDSTSAHFTKADTIVPGAGNLIAYNRYAYVLYNPLRYIDPSGQKRQSNTILIDGDHQLTSNVILTDGGYSQLVIISRQEWEALEPGSIVPAENARYDEVLYNAATAQDGYMQYTDSLADVYDTIVIHHTSPLTSSSTPYAIQYAEMSDGMYDIGYHFIIGADGTIYEGRDIFYRGLHVAPGVDPVTGDVIGNTGRIGIALIGDFTIETPTQSQEDALVSLVQYLDSEYGTPYIFGHYQLNSTVCPGENAYYLIELLRGLSQ